MITSSSWPLLVSMLRAVVFVLLTLVSLQTSAAYEVKVLASGNALKQSAAFDGDSVVVFSTRPGGDRYFQRLPLAGEAGQIEPLPQSVIFVDEVMTPDGRKVALVHRDKVTLLGSEELLLRFTSVYNAPVYETIPWKDVFLDLNDDGLDDFVIPTFEGYQVAVQNEQGKFSQPITLEGQPLMDMSYNSHPWYQAKSLFHADMNGDGRKDLSFWQDKTFLVYAQLENGRFASKVTSIPVALDIDYDGVDGMSLRFSNQDQSNNSVTVIHNLADFDGDGATDLMTMRVDSEGVLNKKTTFALHLGEFQTDGIIAFSPEPISRVESNGIQYDMLARDLDNDGDLDLMISSVELGVGKIIGALLTSSLKIDLGFYPMAPGGYPERAATTRNMTATFSLSSGDYWLPAVLLLDENRDGLTELFIQESDESFTTYLGSVDGVFARRGESLEAPLPRDPDLIRQIDVNQDGVSDVLMLVPPPLGETKGHRVVLLLSNQPF